MKINKIKYLLFIFSIVAFVGCEEDIDDYTYTGEGDAPAYSFARTSQTVGVCEPTVPVVVEVTKDSNQDTNVGYVVNADLTTALPNEYSFAGTAASIAAGEYTGSVDITVDFGAIPEGESRQVVLDLVVPENGTLNARGQTTINFSSACVLNEVVVDLVFDSFPEECAWALVDADGNLVSGSLNAGGGLAFGLYAGLDNFSTTLCLPDGDYTAIFFDSYGDGNTAGVGSYGMSLASCEGTTALFTPLSDSGFGANGSFLGTPPVSIDFTIGD